MTKEYQAVMIVKSERKYDYAASKNSSDVFTETECLGLPQ